MDHPSATNLECIETSPCWRPRYAVAVLMFGAVAAYFLRNEHRDYLIGALPLLLLLAWTFRYLLKRRGRYEDGREHESQGNVGHGSKQSIAQHTNEADATVAAAART
jgi:Protein of unknown function (DUF2933)